MTTPRTASWDPTLCGLIVPHLAVRSAWACLGGTELPCWPPEDLQNLGCFCAATMLPADLRKSHDALLVDDKRRGICRFIRSVPAQTVELREDISRVEQQVESVGERLVPKEFVCARFEALCRPRI